MTSSLDIRISALVLLSVFRSRIGFFDVLSMNFVGALEYTRKAERSQWYLSGHRCSDAPISYVYGIFTEAFLAFCDLNSFLAANITGYMLPVIRIHAKILCVFSP